MSSNDRTEREGVFAVGLATEQAGWAFRESGRPDRGVDAHVEGRTDGRPDGRLLALQIKSGESHFGHSVPGGWRYYVKRDHIEYWSSYTLPVVLVLYDPRIETAYWQVVNPDTAQSTGELFAVDVPRSHVFDSRCGADLDRLAGDQSSGGAGGLRDRRVALDLGWIWMLDAGERLFLEVDQDVNPADGRCVLRLVAEDLQKRLTTMRTWPWTFLSGQDFGGELSRLFSWADKRVDASWYRTHAVADFLTECAHWDAGEEAYEYTADFDEWLAEKFGSEIAPYAVTSDGTKALWRLELTLNDEGRAALAKDKDEILADAWREVSPRSAVEAHREGGYYTIESVDHTYSRHGSLDVLAFIYGDDDDQESLLVEPKLWTTSGTPAISVVDEILRHARGTPATESLLRAFTQRFATHFDPPDGIMKITMSEIDDWLGELVSIAKFGTDADQLQRFRRDPPGRRPDGPGST